MGYTETVGLNIVATGTFNNLLSEVNRFKSELKALKLPDNVTKKLEGSFDKLNVEAEKFKNILNKGVTTKGDFSKLISSAKDVDAAMKNIKRQVNDISDKQLRISIQNLPEVKKLESELNKLLNLQKQFKNYGTTKATGATSAKEVAQIDQLISKMQEAKSIRNAFNQVGNAFATGNIDRMSVAIQKLIQQVNLYKSSIGSAQGVSSSNAILAWANSLQQGLNKTVSEADRLKNSINQLQTNKFNQMKGSIDGISSGLNTATNNMRNFVNTQTQAASKTSQLSEQVGLLRTQANYFFGLQNVGRLISRGIKQAADSVRDLDKAMTATAVVTPYSVKDMWDMLPEYTALANKLGATTQGAYETMTLYFQQGLNKEQTFQIGEETMKMARIAGLDYAQTTNMMTAALRGFNMELNNTSAQRVNDVYSKLAAITASDTRELGLAMERTASIANSAGMDFGNTTAFLAQMIETTREAPENLGTAMKTIVARFQELKQNPYEIGEVEGEEVDFNRVDKALKTIGVDLMDNRDKFRDLDEVFLEISEKWDGLSQTQQRYIATIAAGARQQSRFIAMVQNYDRLKELTEAAANSEGAAEVQFSKTLDSYEAKVNKLKNAWQTFTMGLADNKVIKGGVGILEKIITLADKIIDLFGKAGNAIGGDFGKSIAQMTAAFGMAAIGFRGLRSGAKMGLGMLDRMTAKNAAGETGILPAGKMAAKGMGDVTKEERAAVMQKRKALYQMMNKGVGTGDQLRPFNIQDLQKNLKDLSAEQQKALYSSSPGLRKAMQRSWGQAYKGMNLTKETSAAVKNQIKTIDGQIKNGETTVQQAIKGVMNPYQMAKNIGGATGRELISQIDKAIQNNPDNKQIQKSIGKHYEKLAKAGKIDTKAVSKNDYIREQLRGAVGKQMINQQTPVAINKATNAMSAFSGATMKGGQAMMGLGMAMSAAGFPAFGGMVMTAGTALMGIGMAAEGAAAGISKVGTAIKSLYASNPVLLAIAAVATAVAGTVAAIKIVHNKATKEARKAGDEVVETYTQATKKAQKELDNLADYKENWATWTAGVDSNGNNIGLETSEYNDYLKAIKKITTAHPELIKGYNALGNAIVDNNTVLQEANRLAKEEEKQAKKDYLADGQKIVNSMKTKKRWKATQSEASTDINSTNIAWGQSINNYKNDYRSRLQKEAQSAMDAIKETTNGEALLKQYGITWDQMGNITEQGIENLRTKAGDLNNALTEDLTGEENEKIATDINDKIATFGETIKGVEDVSKDYYDWAWAYATEQGYADIDSNLIIPLQTSIQRLAEKGLSANKTKSAVDELGKKYQDLGGYAEDFNDIQSKVEEAQKEFGRDLDTEKYKSKVEKLTMPMDNWIKDLKSSTDQADQILGEYIETQKNKFLNLSESLPTLEEGFNTLSGNIASANKAYDNWSKQNEKGDYYTGVEGFKKMYDEVNDGIDDLGKKSGSWWSAAQSMFGDDYVMKNGTKKVAAHMKEISKYLEEGKTGIDSFLSKIRDSQQEITLDEDLFGKGAKVKDYIENDGKGGLNFKIKDLSDEQFESLANSLGYSDELFTSLLNKARQFYNIDFMNVDDMRQALAGSETSLLGITSNKNGLQHIYTKESDFIQQGLANNMNPDEIKKAQKKLEKSGVIFLKSVNELNKGDFSKYIKDWGLNTGTIKGGKNGKETFNTTNTHDFIAALNKAQYGKEEIKEAYETATKGKDSLITDKDKVNFDEVYKEIKAAEDPTFDSVSSIQSSTEGILSAVNAIALSMGILTKGGKEEIQGAVDKANEYAKAFKSGDQWTTYDDFIKDFNEQGSELTLTRDTLLEQMDKYAKDDPRRAELEEQVELINGALKKLNNAFMTEEEFVTKQNENRAKDLYKDPIKKYGKEAYSAAVQQYLEKGFGNTKLGGRGELEWTDKELEGTNFKNAATWGWKKKDLKGSYSTYMSDVLTSKDLGDKEGEYAISVTPMFQGKNGPEVLSKDVVTQYMQSLLDQSTDENGTIDWNKLLSLDNNPEATDLVTESGEKLHGLFMGAFEGEGNEQAAEAFGALEHLLSSEGLMATDTSASGLATLASDANNLMGILQQTGAQGQEMAEALQVSFLDLNQNALNNLDGHQLYQVISALGITKEKLATIQQEHPEIDIKTEVDDSELTETEKETAEATSEEYTFNYNTEVTDTTDLDQLEARAEEEHPWVLSPTVGDFNPNQITPAPTSKTTPKSESATSTYTVEVSGQDKVDDLQTKINNLNAIVNKGGTYNLTVTGGTKKLAAAAKAAKKVTDNQGDKSINVSATATGTEDVNAFNTAVKASKNLGNKTVKLTAKTSGTLGVWALVGAVKAFHALNDKTVTNKTINWTVTKKTNEGGPSTGGYITSAGVLYRARGGVAEHPGYPKKGTDIIPAYLTPGEYVQNRKAVNYFGIDFMRKINHKDLSGALQTLGSAAKGRNGKGKGGLSLTGEKGFEIAWLPSQNQSMILGAKGPQMLDLPSDAVIWNHQQSKQIVKRKPILANSFADVGGGTGPIGGGTSSYSSSSKKSKKHKKRYKKQKSGKKEQVREVITDGEISSKIFNLEQRIAQVKIKQEKAQKALNKQLEIAYNTLKDIKKNGNEDIKRLKQSAQLNQKLVNIYNNQLKTLDKSGDGKKKIEWTNPTEKRKKKGKKWGKWKSEGTKKHTASIDLGNYIKYDADTGAYVVQYEKINKAFGKDKNKAKAVKEAAEKEISEKTSKRDSAQSALDDANEKLAELGKQLYENFYSWKNELTKILEITKQIEAVQQQSERFKSALSLDETMAANFMKFGNSLDFFKAQLNSTIKEIDKRDNLINQQKETTLRAVSTEDEQKEYDAVSDKIKKGEAARKKQEALTKAKNQVKADNDAIKARDTLLNKKDKKGKKTTLSKETKKRDAAAKKETSLEKKKTALEKKLKNKKLSKKKRNKYEQELKSVKEDISKQKKIKNAAQKNIDIIKKGNKAEKNLQKHTDAQNTAQTKYDAVKNENLSDTEMLAEQERQKQLEEQLKIQTEAQKYVKSKINADGTLDVTIDEDALNKARDEGKISKELYEGIKAYYDNLTEESSNLGNLYDDQLKAFSDLHTTLKDLKEDYADKSEELLSAAEEADKNEIEQFEKLNSSLTDALKDLLDEVKTKLDERRKQEDNKKTEQDISKKQQRLAALRADTAGGHQVEIAQLEKEIAEAQQSYQRTLEDQLLDRLQTQADEAAKQRERQISLMNGQLEVAKATGSNVALINQYLSDPEHYSAEIEALWKAAKDYDNQTDARKDILDAEWESFKESLNTKTGLPAQIDLTNQAITETAGKLDILKKALQDAADEINKKGPVQEPPKENPPEENPPEENPPEEKTFSLREGLNARPAIDEISEDGASLEQIQQALVKRYGSTENILKALSESDYSITDTRKYLPNFTYEQARQVYSAEALTKDSEFKDRANYDALLEKRKEEKSITSAQINKLFEYGQKLNKGKKQVLQEIMGGKGADPFTWDNTIKAVLGAKGIDRWNLIKTFGDNSSASKAVQKHFKKKLKQIKAQKGWKTAKAFETGGLASYTGPAWLDGTPSKPELVLNAADTQNFLALKDVLSRAVNSSNSVSNSYGDTTYEININVDHINNDYDVDRIAERVKKDIVKSAGYRNTTQVRNFR